MDLHALLGGGGFSLQPGAVGVALAAGLGAAVLRRSHAAALVDRLAPEHLQLMLRDPDPVFARIRHAGAALLHGCSYRAHDADRLRIRRFSEPSRKALITATNTSTSSTIINPRAARQ